MNTENVPLKSILSSLPLWYDSLSIDVVFDDLLCLLWNCMLFCLQTFCPQILNQHIFCQQSVCYISSTKRHFIDSKATSMIGILR